MASTFHGLPCWYELSTTDAAAAQRFYGPLFGWTWTRAEMPGMDYFIASRDGVMIAGAMAGEAGGPPPAWTTYFAVDDVDATVAAMAAEGAGVIVQPTDIPGTGRFAVLSDPQGAVFGLLQPLPMEDGGAGGAFDLQKNGHVNWNELMAADAAAALDFYCRHLGWTPSRAMEMGPGMTYHIFAQGGRDIGGMMDIAPGMPGPGFPSWLPYFGVEGIGAALAAVTAAGGRPAGAPQEVPGGTIVASATDPQGAAFAMAGRP